MMQRSVYSKGKVTLIRFCYLMPLIGVIAILIAALIPHIFFQDGTEAYKNLTLFTLMGNTYDGCLSFFRGTAQGTTADFYFSLKIFAVWLLSVACMVIYGVFVLATALCVPLAWFPNASTPLGNKLKRIYRLIVPNRVFYVLFQLLPVFPSLFPYFLQRFYRTMLGQKITAHYVGLPDWIPVLLLTAASVALFLGTLRMQKDCRMDLFRIFKLEEKK